MSLWKKLFKRQKMTYFSALKLIEENNISSLRKRTKILIVDDESDDIYQVLKERQYEVYYKNDMTYPIEAEPFEVVIMDIKGVANRLRSSMGGFSLACDVKQKYPLKKVCCYSGTTSIEVTNHLTDNKIDLFMVKDSELDKMCEKIDQLILDYANSDKQWQVLYKEFKKNKIDDEDIARIKEAYDESFKNGNIESLNTVILENIKNGKAFLEIVTCIFELMKVLMV